MSELNVYHHELRPNEYDEFYLKYEADKMIAEMDKEIEELKSDIRKLLIEYHKTLDSNESLKIAATESMRIVERKNMALMKCRRQIAHLNSLLSNTIIWKLKYNRQFGYWNDKILDEKFKEAK